VPRLILIRSAAGDRTVPESQLPVEQELHDALSEHPGLIPFEDLGLADPIVVGKESSLGGGFADLVLLDRAGRLAIVEVKKQGNPDLRHVVAQLLGYAAGLWGQTLEQFMDAVVRPHLARTPGATPAATLEELLADSFERPSALAIGEDVSAAASTLGGALASGDFTLIVAAPEIPEGVERALEYLNARGMRMYGVEIGYFNNQNEACFVPRVTVKPPAVRTTAGRAAPVERESFLASLDDLIAATIGQALDQLQELGAKIEWNSFGASIKVNHPPLREIAGFMRKSMFILTKPPRDYPDSPFAEARQALAASGIGGPNSSGDYHRVPYTEPDSHGLATVIDILTELTRAL
jgi:hypothetical protein